jgi:hypothetical protein
MPASFAQDGLTMAVTPTGEKTFVQTSGYSGLFQHVFGGALTDGFLLTQFPGIPPSTLTLAFSADIVAFSADFGMLVDFGVVADPTPASLRLEAFEGSQQLGSLVVTPTGGPSVYEGVVSFAHPTSEPFDRVVLTSLPAAFDAGSPEFILDNVRVTQIPEPSVLLLGVVGLVVLTLLGARSSSALLAAGLVVSIACRRRGRGRALRISSSLARAQQAASSGRSSGALPPAL